MSLYAKINEDLQKALKERNALRLETLRMIKSKILYVNARGDLPDQEIVKVINKYAKSLAESVEEFKKVNRPEEAKKVESEIKIIEEYLPKKMSEDEIKAIVEKVIPELGASTMKDMGKVMKEVIARCPTADATIIKNLVTQKLGG